MSTIIGRSKESGHKIVVLSDLPATMREGSLNTLYFSYLIKSKTTDEAAEKIRKTNDKPWDIVRLAMKRGLIKLGEPVPGAVAKAKATKTAPAKGKAVAKPAAKAKVTPAKAKAAPKAKVAAPRKAKHSDEVL